MDTPIWKVLYCLAKAWAFIFWWWLTGKLRPSCYHKTGDKMRKLKKEDFIVTYNYDTVSEEMQIDLMVSKFHTYIIIDRLEDQDFQAFCEHCREQADIHCRELVKGVNHLIK